MVDGRQKGHVFDFRFHHGGAVDVVDVCRNFVSPVDFYSFSVLLKTDGKVGKTLLMCTAANGILSYWRF